MIKNLKRPFTNHVMQTNNKIFPISIIPISNIFFISLSILPTKLTLDDINKIYPIKGNIINKPPTELLPRLQRMNDTPKIYPINTNSYSLNTVVIKYHSSMT